MSTFLAQSPWLSAACAAVCALIACALILGLLLKTGLAWRLATDVPNDRSLHTRPTPRVGGWGVVPVTAIAMLLFAPSIWLAAIGAAFFTVEATSSVRPALFASFALFALSILTCVAFLTWMRRAVIK